MTRIDAAALCMVGIMAVPSFSSAQNKVTSPPAVVLRFDGGNMGENMGRALDILADEFGPAFRTKEVVINNSICQKLADLGYPPPCRSFSNIIDRLNKPGKFGSKVGSSDVLVVPDLSLSNIRSTRVFNSSNEPPPSWANLNLQIIKGKKNQDPLLKFDAITLTVAAPSDVTAVEAAGHLSSIGLMNTSIRPIRTSSQPTKFYSIASAPQIQGECLKHQSIKGIFYTDLSDVESSEIAALEAQEAAETSAPAVVSVTLIDTPIMPSPNINPHVKASADWKCIWEDFTEKDHGTHLAGIIGSAPNGYGFVGLAQNIHWDGFPWVVVDNATGKLTAAGSDRVGELVRFIDVRTDYRAKGTLQVFVAALSFDDYPAGTIGSDGNLRSGSIRFRIEPGITIQRDRPLLIVAAGQSQAGQKALELSATTPLSPQNLGDLENVIVVTACDDCSKANPTLYSLANVSSSSRRFVHVVAPSATPIPGWVSDHGVGAAGGTSQAAAYVAGMAASMISEFPNIYVEARWLKRRIQTTSWPIPSFQQNGETSPASEQVSAGLVDPILARLDPKKTWVKTGGRWSSLQLRSIDSIAFLDDRDESPGFLNSDMLRMMKTPDLLNSSHWTLYIDGAHLKDGVKGDVIRRSMLHASSSSKFMTCDGSAHSLLDYDDIIIAQGGVDASNCQ